MSAWSPSLRAASRPSPGLFLAPHFQPHGLAAVRAGTGVGGQSAGDDGEEDQLARVVRDNGMNQSEIAEIFWMGRMTLYRHLEGSVCTTTALTFASSRPRC